jgi:transcriptional regulator with XRE-family HTH domain
MSELTETLRKEFKDKETRHVYCDEFLNSSIATQIKVLREQRGLTQKELAERADMRQERISVLEDVNYSSWTINVLRRLAEAFDLTLTVKFESFGEKLFAIEDMSRETLEKPSFDEDPVFQEQPKITSTSDVTGPSAAIYRSSNPPEDTDDNFLFSLLVKEKTAEHIQSVFTKSETLELSM